MTLTEIYDRVVFHIWGETAPPAAATTALQAVPEGIICVIHKNIQRDYNYWFMEEKYDFTIISGTQNYALPTDFKEEISLRLLHSGGYYNSPMTKLRRNRLIEAYSDPSETAEYPCDYEMWEQELWLWPIPSYSTTLTMRYYKYLPDVTTFAGHTDDLTAVAGNLIVFSAAAEMEMSLENDPAKLQHFWAKQTEEIKLLKFEHFQKAAANFRKLEYQGV
jgi:hypothetical protein